MEQKESEVTRKVREAIVRAAEKGENLSRKVSEISRKSVKDTLDKHAHDIDKVEEISKHAAKGFLKAVKESGLKLIGLYEHAVTGISQGAESLGEKAYTTAKTAAEKTIRVVHETKNKSSKIAKDTANGVFDGIKKISEKKTQKKGKEK